MELTVTQLFLAHQSYYEIFYVALTLEALGRQNDVRSCFQIIAAVKKIFLCG